MDIQRAAAMYVATGDGPDKATWDELMHDAWMARNTDPDRWAEIQHEWSQGVFNQIAFGGLPGAPTEMAPRQTEPRTNKRFIGPLPGA